MSAAAQFIWNGLKNPIELSQKGEENAEGYGCRGNEERKGKRRSVLLVKGDLKL